MITGSIISPPRESRLDNVICFSHGSLAKGIQAEACKTLEDWVLHNFATGNIEVSKKEAWITSRLSERSHGMRDSATAAVWQPSETQTLADLLGEGSGEGSCTRESRQD